MHTHGVAEHVFSPLDNNEVSTCPRASAVPSAPPPQDVYELVGRPIVSQLVDGFNGAPRALARSKSSTAPVGAVPILCSLRCRHYLRIRPDWIGQGACAGGVLVPRQTVPLAACAPAQTHTIHGYPPELGIIPLAVQQVNPHVPSERVSRLSVHRRTCTHVCVCRSSTRCKPSRTSCSYCASATWKSTTKRRELQCTYLSVCGCPYVS